jgi:hypothetical protein
MTVSFPCYLTQGEIINSSLSKIRIMSHNIQIGLKIIPEDASWRLTEGV